MLYIQWIKYNQSKSMNLGQVHTFKTGLTDAHNATCLPCASARGIKIYTSKIHKSSMEKPQVFKGRLTDVTVQQLKLGDQQKARPIVKCEEEELEMCTNLNTWDRCFQQMQNKNMTWNDVLHCPCQDAVGSTIYLIPNTSPFTWKCVYIKQLSVLY